MIECKFCIKCDKKIYPKVFSHEIRSVIKGIECQFVEKKAMCPWCGEEIYVGEINDKNMFAREIAYRDAVFKEKLLFNTFFGGGNETTE